MNILDLLTTIALWCAPHGELITIQECRYRLMQCAKRTGGERVMQCFEVRKT